MPRTLQVLLALATLSLAFSFGVDDQNSATLGSLSKSTIEDVISTVSESTDMMPTISTTIKTREPIESKEVPETSTVGIATTKIPSKVGRVTKVTSDNTKNQFPSTSKRRNDSLNVVWECPNITGIGIECSCDFPHTLRCTGDRTALQAISRHLRHSHPGISLLDVTVTGISVLPAHFLEDIALHGLVVSTGELRRVHENAFTALSRPLQALGLPNNILESVPTAALRHLVGLDRLDLSRNKLKTLEADSFVGLMNLTYLDLCDNLLSQLSPQAFASLPTLRYLKMRGNHLSVSALSALRGLKRLEELDLSRNMLVGPISSNLLPLIPRLRSLSISENELINVKQGALSGLRNLTYLSLSHNQIDVLEDHAFKYLHTLTRLDLANNRIVAVSSSSLAHLENLTMLDLTHNFLRSLTSDLILPLKNLQDLRLDDNDITMVATDVPTSKLKLKRLSLSDNPLNCDCTLLDFANWLTNSSLEEEDKLSAVCATPPALENGILSQVSPGSLLCGDPTPSTRLPVSGVQIVLKEFQYDDINGMSLLWTMDPCREHYTCDNLMIYETVGGNEIQIESSPLHCDSRLMRDKCSLPVTIPSSLHMELQHKYRYCVTILISSDYDDLSLGLGCSDIILLEETRTRRKENFHLTSKIKTKNEEQEIQREVTTREPAVIAAITAVHVNVSTEGFLQVDVSLSLPPEIPAGTGCELSVVVFATESASVHRKKMNCSLTFITLSGLVPGRYKVCASLDEITGETVTSSGHDRYRCVEVQMFKQNSEVWVLVIIAAISILLVILILISRSLMKKIRHPKIQTQCFMPAQEFEITQKAHYIKLLATTKV